jgi:hypothetical protein
MQWTRLYVVVEGQSEREFVKTLLVPHLAAWCIEVKPKVVVTSRKLNKRGGLVSYGTLRGDLLRLFAEDGDPATRFTTMLDLYKLPPDFPGNVDSRNKPRAARVEAIEAALLADLGDVRLIPHIQVHEFETLLYCNLHELARRIEGSEASLAELATTVSSLSPEDINEGLTTAPSKRILARVPSYERLKVRVGAPAAAAIGLPVIRAKCPHFDAWIAMLEQFGTPLA